MKFSLNDQKLILKFLSSFKVDFTDFQRQKKAQLNFKTQFTSLQC